MKRYNFVLGASFALLLAGVSPLYSQAPTILSASSANTSAVGMTSVITHAADDVKTGKFADALALLQGMPIDTSPVYTNLKEREIADVQYVWAQSLLDTSPAKALPHYQAALVIDQAQRPAQAANDLNEIGLSYKDLSEFNKAADYFQQALPLFQKARDNDGTAMVLENIGIVDLDLNEYDNVVDYAQRALSLFIQTGDKSGEAQTLDLLGSAFHSMKQYAKAIAFHQQALHIFQHIGDVKDEAGTFNNMGVVYRSLGQYSKAIGFYQQALSLIRQIGDINGQATTLTNLGNANASTKVRQYNKAIELYRQALPLYQRVGNKKEEADNLMSLGYVYKRLHENAQAVHSFQSAMGISHQIGDKDMETVAHRNIDSLDKLK